MKILLVSYWFPPVNVIGAVRMGKFAKYLLEAGHDVNVLTAAAPNTASMGMAPNTNDLPVEIPHRRIIPVAGRNVDEVFDPLIRRLRRWGGRRNAHASESARQLRPIVPARRSAFVKHYYALLRIPDSRSGWIGPATAAARKLVANWKPDVVIGSAPPNSALVAAARIAQRVGAPWIAELRDLWADNSYYGEPGWRLWLDRRIEHRILSTAAALVTVSPIWADTLRRKYPKPVACILNGYVDEDFPSKLRPPTPGEVVSIVYTGNIYPGYRDPTPLFRAIQLLDADRRHVAVHLYGPDQNDLRDVLRAASSLGIVDRLFLHDRVPYHQSLQLQSAADVLLLLQWNNPKDAGNIPAKFFEYIGAGRPILLIGYEHGDLADMIRRRGAGLVANDPAVIANQLRRWIAERHRGGIPMVTRTARTGFTRTDQFQEYERFISGTLRAFSSTN